MFTGFHLTLLFTVALIVVTVYFLLGGTPLLKLKHDTELDARFIRKFFRIYCMMALCVASIACIGSAMAGRNGFAVGAGVIAVVALTLRQTVVAWMERVGAQIQQNQAGAILKFRQLHVATLVVILSQLVGIGWSLTKIGL